MNRPFIVAELSANHLGDLHRAYEIIEIAADMGADAIKFQTFTPEQMVDEHKVIEAGEWAGRKAIDLYREACTHREWHPALFAHAKKNSLVAFSSVFHPDDIDFLETLDCPIYKISSFENRDGALIQHAAKTGKPIMISTGMATWADIEDMLFNAGVGGAKGVTLLKCTSAYPADATEANLACMAQMQTHLQGIWRHDVGLSDHTPGIGVAVAATVLGATVIEKHLTLSRRDGGPDAAFSMEPGEFAQMVTECRRAAAAIGTVQYGPTPSEAPQVLLRRKAGGKRGQ